MHISTLARFDFGMGKSPSKEEDYSSNEKENIDPAIFDILKMENKPKVSKSVEESEEWFDTCGLTVPTSPKLRLKERIDKRKPERALSSVDLEVMQINYEKAQLKKKLQESHRSAQRLKEISSSREPSCDKENRPPSRKQRKSNTTKFAEFNLSSGIRKKKKILSTEERELLKVQQHRKQKKKARRPQMPLSSRKTPILSTEERQLQDIRKWKQNKAKRQSRRSASIARSRPTSPMRSSSLQPRQRSTEVEPFNLSSRPSSARVKPEIKKRTSPLKARKIPGSHLVPFQPSHKLRVTEAKSPQLSTKFRRQNRNRRKLFANTKNHGSRKPFAVKKKKTRMPLAGLTSKQKGEKFDELNSPTQHINDVHE